MEIELLSPFPLLTSSSLNDSLLDLSHLLGSFWEDDSHSNLGLKIPDDLKRGEGD